jgi:hypothetical protein
MSHLSPRLRAPHFRLATWWVTLAQRRIVKFAEGAILEKNPIKQRYSGK